MGIVQEDRPADSVGKTGLLGERGFIIEGGKTGGGDPAGTRGLGFVGKPGSGPVEDIPIEPADTPTAVSLDKAPVFAPSQAAVHVRTDGTAGATNAIAVNGIGALQHQGASVGAGKAGEHGIIIQFQGNPGSKTDSRQGMHGPSIERGIITQFQGNPGSKTGSGQGMHGPTVERGIIIQVQGNPGSKTGQAFLGTAASGLVHPGASLPMAASQTGGRVHAGQVGGTSASLTQLHGMGSLNSSMHR